MDLAVLELEKQMGAPEAALTGDYLELFR